MIRGLFMSEVVIVLSSEDEDTQGTLTTDKTKVKRKVRRRLLRSEGINVTQGTVDHDVGGLSGEDSDTGSLAGDYLAVTQFDTEEKVFTPTKKPRTDAPSDPESDNESDEDQEGSEAEKESNEAEKEGFIRSFL